MVIGQANPPVIPADCRSLAMCPSTTPQPRSPLRWPRARPELESPCVWWCHHNDQVDRWEVRRGEPKGKHSQPRRRTSLSGNAHMLRGQRFGRSFVEAWKNDSRMREKSPSPASLARGEPSPVVLPILWTGSCMAVTHREADPGSPRGILAETSGSRFIPKSVWPQDPGPLWPPNRYRTNILSSQAFTS